MRKEEKPKPIKRIEELQPLSREHHFGLLVCWKIKQGIKKGIELERIKKYTDWFWDKHLQYHFEIEENYIFPILGNKHSLIVQAIKEHQQLKEIFNDQADLSGSLSQLGQELQKHIRFEERVLFNEIQKVATKEELDLVATVHTSNFKEDYQDEFWLK
ncbi:MAG: iron-sulfur cluster repair protein YtfE (RIC family) [bacterium]|jgi:iron-sulfur cluster repair protein YtfE (RIC family)